MQRIDNEDDYNEIYIDKDNDNENNNDDNGD